jgi:hypothetical protein
MFTAYIHYMTIKTSRNYTQKNEMKIHNYKKNYAFDFIKF